MNKFLLTEGKKKIKVLQRVQNAMYKHDKKEGKAISKAIKKTIKEKEKEVIMKKWSMGSIVAAIGVILTIFWTYTENTANQAKSFQKLESGLVNNSKDLSELIKITKKVAEKQSDLKAEVATIKVKTETNSKHIDVLDDRLYKRKRK